MANHPGGHETREDDTRAKRQPLGSKSLPEKKIMKRAEDSTARPIIARLVWRLGR